VTAVASRRWGEGRDADAAEAGYQAFLLSLLAALVVGTVGLFSLWPLFAVMRMPTDVTVAGAGYLAVYLTGCPVVFAWFAMDAAFRAAGDTRTPLRILVIALIANAILDPLLILGPGPLPRLGIQGAALATILTRAGGCAIGYRWLARRGLLRRCRPRAATMRGIAWIGLPVGVGGLVFSLVYVGLARFTAAYDTAGLAALAVGHRIESLSFLVCIGFGFAAATSVGQNLGAGRTDRAIRSGHAALVYALVVMAVIALLFLAIPRELIAVFSEDPGVIADGASYLRIVAVAQLFMALELVLQIAMEGAGYTLPPMFIGVGLTTLRLPLAWWLRGPLGLAGIWWAISLTSIARGLAMLGLWRRGTWRGRRV
jgi:putative MATE family efflux protein